MGEDIKCSCEEMGKAIIKLENSIKEFNKKQECINELCEKYTHEQLAKMYVEKEEKYNLLEMEADRYQQECANLESELAAKENLLKIKAGVTQKEDDLPFNPISVADYLINLTYERETSPFERSFGGLGDTTFSQKYEVDELEQIAEHLLIYCKHSKAVES